MIRLTARLVGSAEVVQAVSVMPGKVRRAAAGELNFLANELVRRVKHEKLTGQVLNVRTDTLRSSVNRDPQGGVRESGGVLSVSVGSNVWYGRMWELTGHKDIFPKKGKFLAWRDKAGWHHAKMVAAQAPRPWLRPALDELKPIAIQRLNAAIAKALTPGGGGGGGP